MGEGRRVKLGKTMKVVKGEDQEEEGKKKKKRRRKRGKRKRGERKRGEKKRGRRGEWGKTMRRWRLI